MNRKTISLLLGFLVFLFGKVYGSEPVDARPAFSDKTQISKAIADRFAEALKKRNYPFIGRAWRFNGKGIFIQQFS